MREADRQKERYRKKEGGGGRETGGTKEKTNRQRNRQIYKQTQR